MQFVLFLYPLLSHNQQSNLLQLVYLSLKENNSILGMQWVQGRGN